MAATLQCLYDLPAELSAMSRRSRRAGYKLDGEWTRSDVSCVKCMPMNNALTLGQ